MKTFVLAALCFGLNLSAADQPLIQIVRGGAVITAEPDPAFTGNIFTLLESCSVHSTAHAVTNSTWKDLLEAKSFVHLTFPKPRSLNVMMMPSVPGRVREQKQLDQILVPLPEGDWPRHIYATSGTNVYAFTKYNPIALKKVALEPALKLSATSPYKELANMRDE